MKGNRVNLYRDRPRKSAPARLPVSVKRIEASAPGPWTADIALRRYPRLIAHMICESPGYFMPQGAAVALADALNGHENWCEYIFSCHNRNPIPVVLRAIHGRWQHQGYMAHYPMALAIVARQVLTGEEPLPASWF